MNKFIKILVSNEFSIMVIASFAILGGCLQAENETKTTNLILDWEPNPDHVAIYAGISQGIFEEQGIDLKILKVIISPTDVLDALFDDQAEIALTYMPHTIQAQMKGRPIDPIGILMGETLNSVIYRNGKGIERPEDLNGKIIGYCSQEFSPKFLEEMFSGRGIVPGEFRDVGTDFVPELEAGNVDALFGAYWNIEGENLKQWGLDIGHFLLTEFCMPNYYELIFVAKKESKETDPQFVQDFKTAIQKSIDFSVKNPEEAFDAYVKLNPSKTNETLKWEKRAWYKTIRLLTKLQEFDQDEWNVYAKWLADHNLVNGFGDHQ